MPVVLLFRLWAILPRLNSLMTPNDCVVSPAISTAPEMFDGVSVTWVATSIDLAAAISVVGGHTSCRAPAAKSSPTRSPGCSSSIAAMAFA